MAIVQTGGRGVVGPAASGSGAAVSTPQDFTLGGAWEELWESQLQEREQEFRLEWCYLGALTWERGKYAFWPVTKMVAGREWDTISLKPAILLREYHKMCQGYKYSLLFVSSILLPTVSCCASRKYPLSCLQKARTGA